MKLSSGSPDAVATELGNRLKQARLNADLTQNELADKAGISIKLVQGAEKGKTQLVTLVAILQALDLAEQLNNFIAPQDISPIQLMKLHGRKRQRASGRKTNQHKEDPEW